MKNRYSIRLLVIAFLSAFAAMCVAYKMIRSDSLSILSNLLLDNRHCLW